MVWALGIVPVEPRGKFSLEPKTVRDGHIHGVVHKLPLEGSVEPLDVGVDLWRPRRTPQVDKMERFHRIIKHRVELTPVVRVDGMDGVREVDQNAPEKARGGNAGDRRHELHPCSSGFDFKGREKDELFPSPVDGHPIKLEIPDCQMRWHWSPTNRVATAGMSPSLDYSLAYTKEEPMTSNHLANPGCRMMRHALARTPRIQEGLEFVFGQVWVLLPYSFEECQQRRRHDHLPCPFRAGIERDQRDKVFPRCEEPLPPAKDGGTGHLGKRIVARLPPVLG